MATAETEQEPCKKLLARENMDKRSYQHGGKGSESHGDKWRRHLLSGVVVRQ